MNAGKNRLPLWQRVFRIKKFANPLLDAIEPGSEGHLKRSIGLWPLVALGIGSVIGTGIFIVLTEAVPKAGPAVLLSFVLAGITAALSALCYAELASAIPVSGSSYSYAYATLGEGVAFVVASCLLLEYGVSVAAVAVGWGQYLNELLHSGFGWSLPESISSPPGHGGVLNVPAMVLVLLCAVLLLRGARESALANALMVLVKLAILALFVVLAYGAFDSRNLTPFAPHGMAGVGAAASSIFFSYIGFDAVSTASEEVENPRRNIPLAIVISLVVVTTVYILVALAGVGAQPAEQFAGQEAGLAAILHRVTGQDWPALMFSAGAMISIFSVVLVVLYGQTRILYAMAKDGMVPPLFCRVNRNGVPAQNTLIVGVGVALLAGLVPLDVLANLTSMGTLVAFFIVSVGVMVLRRKQPGLKRSFSVPLYPLTPVVSAVFCLYLIVGLAAETLELFLVWVGVALLFYFAYSIRNSKLELAHAAG